MMWSLGTLAPPRASAFSPIGSIAANPNQNRIRPISPPTTSRVAFPNLNHGPRLHHRCLPVFPGIFLPALELSRLSGDFFKSGILLGIRKQNCHLSKSGRGRSIGKEGE